MSLRIYDLTCEYMTDPIGLDEPHPRFSYRLASEEAGCRQRTRRLQVSLSEDFSRTVADSGTVQTDETLFAELDLRLSPATRYYYRFIVGDSLGREAVSETAFFETGLMGSAWRAKWITRPDDCAASPVVPRFFRRFRLSETPVRARLYITACGVYRAQLNGLYVSPDLLAPGFTDYHNIHQYQTYDVTELLRRGANELSALVGPGWYSGNLLGRNRVNIYGDRTALLCRLDMTFADGRTRRILSDERFGWCESEVLTSEIYHGETIDARRKSLPERPVAILARGYANLRGQQCQSVRPIEEIEPVALFTTPKGERVLDFGQNMVGFVRVRVKAPAGMEVRLRHFEVLDRDGNAYYENYRSARATASYITDGGEDVFEALLTFYGFRYCSIDAFPGEPSLSDFTGVVIHSELEPTNRFSCSEPLLNQLQHNIIWGQKGNFVDVPTDCPQRDERLGWTGDAQVFCSTALFNMQCGAFFTKWLRDLAADVGEAGNVPFIVPNVMLKQTAASAWSDAVTIIPTDMWQRYGDRRVLQEAYPSMKKWIGYMKNHGEDPYTFEGHFQFGDWLAMDGDSNIGAAGGTDTDLIGTAFYAHSTRLCAQCAEILGKKGDAARYRALHKKVLAAFRRNYLSPAGRLCAGPRNQTAFVLAIWFGLVEGKALEHAKRMLVRSLDASRDHLTTGFIGTPYLCHTLSAIGRSDKAFALLMQQSFPSWLFSVKMGATTMWEHWDGIRPDGTFWSPTMNSYNHYAYGSIGDWMYRHIGGVCNHPDYPAYKRFIYAPIPGGGGLEHAHLAFQSPRGLIQSDWELSEGIARLRLTVPPNCEAQFIPQQQAEGGELSVCCQGTPLTACKDGMLLGPGRYEICYPVAQAKPKK